ncbi:GTP-binding protein [Ramlibacter sp.]|uniref:CobW family GTP-binding protein n=1 Tax=Ramlibacter sp. TaxID=1917967 RepID=UPI0026314863|nr:GTP-binding protein [Ramlibacter sp.]MDB5955872.1 GTP-binding protein [Ramlibacter sp.]
MQPLALAQHRDGPAGRIPVTLVTGFLGSGKTTLLSHVLRQPEMNRAAVVINEIGEVGIDHELVAVSSENISVLVNGCICCTVRTDLQETLRELFGQRRAGQVPDFDRVIVETTGLADPAPVVQTLVSDTMLAAHYRVDGVVTLVDAVHGQGLLRDQPEARKQVALADRVLVSKSDLATPQQLAGVRADIESLNRTASIHTVLHGQLDPALLVGIGLASARAGEHTLRFLNEAPDHRLRPFPGGASPHLADIRTFSLRIEEAFTWDAFAAAMDLLTSVRGADLLRAKGIVNVDGQPVVVQCVQHIFHPAVPLDRWPSDDHATRLVFITRRLEERVIRSLFGAVRELAPSGGQESASQQLRSS